MCHFFSVCLSLISICLWPFQVFSQIKTGTLIVRPKEIQDILQNPGIGFTTFQRFNGDTLNSGIGWTEGYPIQYQKSNNTAAYSFYNNSTVDAAELDIDTSKITATLVLNL